MTFTIKPSCTMDAQISMLESVEDEGYISPAASMTWIFNDGVLETKVRGGTFTISKTTRTKIENILIKMITFWQQYFFRSVIENQLIPERRMPVIDDEGHFIGIITRRDIIEYCYNRMKGCADSNDR